MDELISRFTPSEVIALAAVLATVIAAVVSTGGAIFAVRLTERRANERERRADEHHREQVARDDRLHQQRIDHEDLHRFSNERRKAYASFIAGCVQLVVQTGSGNRPPFERVMNANRFYQEIVVMARRDIAQKASYLWDIVSKLSADPSQYNSLKNDFQVAIKSFEDAVRDEIALAPTEGPHAA